MFVFVATIHVIASVILVVFVLLQNPKGGGTGILGGQSGSKNVFSSTGASNFLVTVTKWSAVVFALTSIQLAYMNSKKDSSVILNQDAPIESSSTEQRVTTDDNPADSP